MNKLDYHSLTKEQKEKIKDFKTQASHRAITSMRQAEEVKKELIDSGFIEGQDFSFEDHEISTKNTYHEFLIKDYEKTRYAKHEYEINSYAGSIKLLWKEVRPTYNDEEDQSHVTPKNPAGYRIVDVSEHLRLATERYRSWMEYQGKYGDYIKPLTIKGSREFCKSYRDVKATTYLKRMREATKNTTEVLKHKLEAQIREMSKKEKIAEAKEILTSQFEDIFLNKIRVNFNSYSFKLEIFFPEGDSFFRGDTIYINYEPERNYECSVYKVENSYGFIPWDKVALIEQLQTEQVEA
jgi:hypothetical protein|tara:strand:+ start:980 stop:1864 length:885 start_codon:yes stop_codon:yes gene_type:complete